MQELASWLDELVGKVLRFDPNYRQCWYRDERRNEERRHLRFGHSNVVGYDVCSYLKIWQKKESLQDMSLCEIILTDDRFKELRDCVGVANVFWSHVQQEHSSSSKILDWL